MQDVWGAAEVIWFVQLRRLRDDFTTADRFLRKGSEGEGTGLFSLPGRRKDLSWTHRNVVKLHQGKFILNIRKRLSTEGMVRHPRAVIEPSLLEFEKHLDNTVRHSLIFRWSCVEPGAGLNDYCGSLPPWNLLWFHHLHTQPHTVMAITIARCLSKAQLILLGWSCIIALSSLFFIWGFMASSMCKQITGKGKWGSLPMTGDISVSVNKSITNGLCILPFKESHQKASGVWV